MAERIEASEEKRSGERLLHDPVTSLPNRTLLIDRLRQAIAFQQRGADHRFALLLLDIDRFKTVNESFGQPAGDRLLASVAHRLARCVRPGDTVARLGGDEFAVLIDDFNDDGEPVRIADRIRGEMGAAHELGGMEVFVSASMGIALASPATTPDDLLRDAETALDRAKQHGRGQHVVFDPGMRTYARDRLEFETDLRRALDRGELRLVYQPIVSLASGRVVGCEALVEWQHPRRGRIGPDDFIPTAEETGLIVPIGEWVLREACREVKSWDALVPPGLEMSVSVNLSGRQLLLPELSDQVRKALADSGLPAPRLRLEITESVVMEDPGPAAVLLQELRDLGVRLVLDDFGTGYSSLSYLHNFRFDTLKIDRSFVGRIDTSKKHAEIVRTIVALARALAMDVVAEGVDSEKQLAQLQSLRCEAAQGFWFSRPLEGARFVALLQSGKAWELPGAPALGPDVNAR